MISALEEINSILRDEIDDAMLLRESARPRSGEKMFQGFGFPDSRERFSQNGLD
jgi:hypothetical protein